MNLGPVVRGQARKGYTSYFVEAVFETFLQNLVQIFGFRWALAVGEPSLNESLLETPDYDCKCGLTPRERRLNCQF